MGKDGGKMKKVYLSLIFIMAFASLSSATFIDDGTLVQTLYDCGELNTTGAVYNANQTITKTAGGVCFNVTANNITVDLMGNVLNYTTAGNAIQSADVNQTIIRNGTIDNMEIQLSNYYNVVEDLQIIDSYIGVRFLSGNNNTIRNVYYDINTNSVHSEYAFHLNGNYGNYSNIDIGVHGYGTHLSYGLWVQSGGNNLFNNITINGFNSEKAELNDATMFSGGRQTFTNSYVTGIGSFMRHQDSNQIIENVTIASFSQGGNAFHLGGNNYIKNMTISGGCTSDIEDPGCRNIYTFQGNNNYLDDITITDGFSHGLRLIGNNNTVINFNITDNTRGITLESTSNENTFNNIFITDSQKDGIYLTTANNNLFDNTVVSGSGMNGIYFLSGSSQESSNNIFKDSIIENNTYSDINISASSTGSNLNNSFLNVSYSTEFVTGISEIVRKWYFNISFSDFYSKAVAVANILFFNASGILETNTTTDSLGSIPIINLTEYVNYNGTASYYSNYSINVSHPRYENFSSSINITGQENLFNNLATIGKPVFPSIQLFPANNAWSSSLPNTFQCNITGEIELTNSTIRIWNSSDILIHSETKTISGINNLTEFDYVFIDQGDYSWGCDTYDSEGYYGLSSNFTVNIDSISPFISVLNTSDNNSYYNKNTIFINVSASDANFKNITYFLYNSTGLQTSSNYGTLTTSKIFTSLQSGNYSYNATICDLADNCNSTATYNITLLNPFINITNPQQGGTVSGSVITLDYNISEGCSDANYTVRDSEGAVNNNLENINLNCSETSTTFAVTSYSTFTLYINATDSVGNIGTEEILFTTQQAESTVISGGGGGGGSIPQTTTVIGVILPENFRPLSDLQRAITYAIFLEIKESGALTNEDKTNIQTNLTIENIYLTLEEITIIDNQIDDDQIDNIEVSKLIAEKYNLLTSRIVIQESDFQVNPRTLSGATAFVCAVEGGEIQKYERPVKANKLFESCSVTDGNWNCEISNDNTVAFITYEIKEPNFFTKTLEGEIKYISQDGEIDYTRVISLNLVNYCAEAGDTGIRIIWIVILSSIGSIIGAYYIYKKIKKRKKR